MDFLHTITGTTDADMIGIPWWIKTLAFLLVVCWVGWVFLKPR